MRFLFFFVHPAKYHFFKHTINRLIREGHSVKVVIISKDVLEPLVSAEKWDYVNLFPEGRRSKTANRFTILFSTGLNFFKTLWRLHRFIGHREFDLVITDDLASITCAYRQIPCVVFTDNELSTVPGSRLLLHFASKILLPESLDLTEYQEKQIRFKGYKESAYLQPRYFSPNSSILEKLELTQKTFFLIRSVAMTASHDVGIQGLSDDRLRELLVILSPHGQVLISSERPLPPDLSIYEARVAPNEILDLLSHAQIFIGDSGTMSSEAALLGTPSIMFHNFVGRLGVMRDKEKSHQIMFGFNDKQFDDLKDKLVELLQAQNLKDVWRTRTNKMFAEHGDLNEFLYSIFTSKGEA